REAVAAAQDEERRRLEASHVTSSALPQLLEASRQRHAAVALAAAAAGRADGGSVTAALRRLFPAEEAGSERVLLATIHKAKGREAERGYRLEPEELGIGADDAVAPPAARLEVSDSGAGWSRPASRASGEGPARSHVVAAA